MTAEKRTLFKRWYAWAGLLVLLGILSVPFLHEGPVTEEEGLTQAQADSLELLRRRKAAGGAALARVMADADARGRMQQLLQMGAVGRLDTEERACYVAPSAWTSLDDNQKEGLARLCAAYFNATTAADLHRVRMYDFESGRLLAQISNADRFKLE